MSIEQSASVRSPAKCGTCATYARSPEGPSLANTEAQRTRILAQRHASSSETLGPTPSRVFATRKPAACQRPSPQSHRALLLMFALAFPLQNQLFSLHISSAPNPTSRRFHIAPRPPIIVITLPYKGASPMALFNLWLVLIHFLSKRSV